MAHTRNQMSSNRLINVELDKSIGTLPSADAEHERKVAIYDLLEENSFALANGAEGPFSLKLSIHDKRLILDVADDGGETVLVLGLSLSPFRRIIKDYFLMCDSYYAAIRNSTPSQIETVDMARRGLHNEGTELLQARLEGKIETDFNTARRLFTLICILHWRGQ